MCVFRDIRPILTNWIMDQQTSSTTPANIRITPWIWNLCPTTAVLETQRIMLGNSLKERCFLSCMCAFAKVAIVIVLNSII